MQLKLHRYEWPPPIVRACLFREAIILDGGCRGLALRNCVSSQRTRYSNKLLYLKRKSNIIGLHYGISYTVLSLAFGARSGNSWKNCEKIIYFTEALHSKCCNVIKRQRLLDPPNTKPKVSKHFVAFVYVTALKRNDRTQYGLHMKLVFRNLFFFLDNADASACASSTLCRLKARRCVDSSTRASLSLQSVEGLRFRYLGKLIRYIRLSIR